jgi:DNA-binding protein HU-beta
MKKSDFITYISEKHTTTKVEAEKVIDMFTSSIMGALGEGNEVSLIGFGNFSVSKVDARAGRNPQTGAVVQIPAYNQVRFKVGQKMKDAVNNK